MIAEINFLSFLWFIGHDIKKKKNAEKFTIDVLDSAKFDITYYVPADLFCNYY